MRKVAVLFARADSVYKTLPGCDVWDIDRDARRYGGSAPVVAHPPCRAWGELRHMANPRPDERELAPWAVDQVRRCGGVLEHPRKSSLWPFMNLPAPGVADRFGGFTFPISQSWFGHRAEKRTFLYIVGIEPRALPAFPLLIGQPSHVIGQTGRRRDGSRRPWQLPEVPKAEREHTPPLLAEWLVELARRTSVIEVAA